MIDALDSQPAHALVERGKSFLDREAEWHAVLQTNRHRQPCACGPASRRSKRPGDARCEGPLQKDSLPGGDGGRALLRKELRPALAHAKRQQRVGEGGGKAAMRRNCRSISGRGKRSAAKRAADAHWTLG